MGEWVGGELLWLAEEGERGLCVGLVGSLRVVVSGRHGFGFQAELCVVTDS